MNHTLLEIENLAVNYAVEDKKVHAVKGLSFALNKGDTLGIIGESGSGKTSLAMAIMGLIKSPGEVKGNIFYKGKDMHTLSKKELDRVRWKGIAIVFQNSLDVLNPLLTSYEQIHEVIIKHLAISKNEANKKVSKLLEMVGLDVGAGDCYPHELSGGMRQRVLIAMALACEPEVLIIDEPTTALDTLSKNKIITLIAKLQKEMKFAMIVISHELQTVLKLTSKIGVIYGGHMVETGLTKEVIKNPMHAYTRGLLNASPVMNPYRDMWGIPGEATIKNILGCPFYERCVQKIAICKENIPNLTYISLERQVACNRGGIVTLLHGKNIHKTYKQKKRMIQACENCNIEIKSGEIVALIGESGSGKSTLANILSGILEPDQGQIIFEDTQLIGNNLTKKKGGIQIVFQDPFSATNERFTIQQTVREPLDIMKVGTPEERKESVMRALEQVQLPYDEDFLSRKCYMLSGGQRQRVAMARSLVMEPKLLIADEISSMLDASTEANMIRLLKGLQNSKGFSMLYITHDLAVARKIADRVYVMYQGKIVEEGMASDIFNAPCNGYTKSLITQG